ncbi:early girl [Stylonychia lemnae]|uniref:Early girl n=1 Tax=Stylonychia lemnae TaxID=5949 RepID=A0A078ALT1_STYLE|nr:early girl [Stylonychia lemnae]|eukprot:CDW83315.1 early girl [Stylonychia lemnae]
MNNATIIDVENIEPELFHPTYPGQQLNNNFICVICQSVVNDPLICNRCENVFCKKCLLLFSPQLNKCPMRCQMPQFGKPIRFFNQNLQELKFKCKYYHTCKQVVTYKNYQQHLRECLAESQPCTHRKCVAICREYQMNNCSEVIKHLEKLCREQVAEIEELKQQQTPNQQFQRLPQVERKPRRDIKHARQNTIEGNHSKVKLNENLNKVNQEVPQKKVNNYFDISQELLNPEEEDKEEEKVAEMDKITPSRYQRAPKAQLPGGLHIRERGQRPLSGNIRANKAQIEKQGTPVRKAINENDFISANPNQNSDPFNKIQRIYMNQQKAQPKPPQKQPEKNQMIGQPNKNQNQIQLKEVQKRQVIGSKVRGKNQAGGIKGFQEENKLIDFNF